MISHLPLRRFIIGAVFLAIFLLFALVGVGYWLLSPVDSGQIQKQTVVIAKGASVQAVAVKLKQNGLIKNAEAFTWLVRYYDLSSAIQAGTFQLSPDMTARQIATALTQGTNDLWITLPEGWRSEEMADALSDQTQLAEFDPEVFLNLAENYPGRLFPDTYLVPKAMTSQAMVELLSTTFVKKVTARAPQFFQLSDQEQDQILIMASLLEREAQGEADMAHVAGILFNRLELGMALQVDATLQYAKGYSAELDSWWVPPTSVDKQKPSVYNTYLHPGLPPKPICHPGISAILAAMNPTQTDDLYYLHDRQGQIHYARTLAEHNKNVSTYLRQ